MAVTSIQVTIGSGTNTQVSADAVGCSLLIFQNNAAHNARYGGQQTTANLGVLLSAGNPGGSGTQQVSCPRGTNLSDWYIAGTQGDVIDVTYDTV